MTDAAEIRAAFASQASACDMLGSPFTATLCRLLAERLDRSTRVGRTVLDWPGKPVADALALRLCGGLHALVLTSRDDDLQAIYPPNRVDEDILARAVNAAFVAHADFLVDFMVSPPQTNETARSAMLLPGFLMVARETRLPLSICEIGASAGLNLFFDRFRYDYAGAGWGDPGSPARLAPEVRGAPPPLIGRLEIAARAGNDISPVDIADPQQKLRLRSYVWADQAARLERLDAAIAIAENAAFTVEKSDAADFVHSRLAERPADAAFVLYHSIMWQYMPQASKDGVLAALEAAAETATADAPIARLRMEPLGEKGFATLSLTMWPGGQTRRLARCDYHGRWIEWIA